MFRTQHALAIALLASLVTGILSSPAHAAKKKRTILILTLEGAPLDQDVVATLDRAIRDEVAASALDHKVLPAPALPIAQMKLALGCVDDDASCFKTIAGTLGADVLLRSVFRGAAEAGDLTFELHRRASTTVRSKTVSLHAVSAESAAEVRHHVAALFGVDVPIPSGSLVLAGRENLEGASVLLDDKPVPLSALETVAPGEHSLEVRLSGFSSFTWSGVVRPGRATEVTVEPVKNATPEPAPEVAPAPPLEPVAEAIPPPQPKAEATPPPPPSESDGPADIEAITEPTQPRIITWVLTGLAGASVIVASVHGVLVEQSEKELNQKAGELNAQCNIVGSPCMNSTRDDRLCLTMDGKEICDRGDRDALIANASWIAAGAFAAGAIVAAFLEVPFGEDDPEEVSFRTSFAPTPDGFAGALEVRF